MLYTRRTDESAVQDALRVESGVAGALSVRLDMDRGWQRQLHRKRGWRTQEVREDAARGLAVADVGVRDQAVILADACTINRQLSRDDAQAMTVETRTCAPRKRIRLLMSMVTCQSRSGSRAAASDAVVS